MLFLDTNILVYAIAFRRSSSDSPRRHGGTHMQGSQLHSTTIPQPRSNQPQPQPRLNHPSCRIKERFRNNHPTSAILQIRQHRAAWPWLVHQLPRPSRRFLHHPRREGDRQAAGNAAVSDAGGEKRKPLAKRAFRGVCPSSFLKFHDSFRLYRWLKRRETNGFGTR